jgi:small subunit ribosomal protein S20
LPSHKSSIKRLKRTEDERVRNNALKTMLRKTLKDVRAKIVEGQQINLNETYSNIDKVASRRTIPKKRASRIKSRLAKAAAKAAQKSVQGS